MNSEGIFPEERVVDPGNVLEVPDKELGAPVRIITAVHTAQTTDEEVGPLQDIHCFALEAADEETYSSAFLPALVVATVPQFGPYNSIRTAADKTRRSMFFVDMHLSRAATKFEDRRRFLKFMVGTGLAAQTIPRSDVPVALRAAAAGILVWIVGPVLGGGVLSGSRPSDLRTTRGKMWRTANTVDQVLHKNDTRFTLRLRNALIAYKTRIASRLQDERDQKQEKNPSAPHKKTLLTIGQGHQLISSLFLKSDQDLLAIISEELTHLRKVDNKDPGMWESVSKITEIWFADEIDKSAHAYFPYATVSSDIPSAFVHAYIHEDLRLKALVEKVRNHK